MYAEHNICAFFCAIIEYFNLLKYFRIANDEKSRKSACKTVPKMLIFGKNEE